MFQIYPTLNVKKSRSLITEVKSWLYWRIQDVWYKFAFLKENFALLEHNFDATDTKNNSKVQ